VIGHSFPCTCASDIVDGSSRKAGKIWKKELGSLLVLKCDDIAFSLIFPDFTNDYFHVFSSRSLCAFVPAYRPLDT
jgi:hypothetical protein